MRLQPIGYSHLGLKNSEGIRYVWQLSKNSPYIESAAFETRAKIQTDEIDNHIAAYTTSVSSGCALTAARVPCKFCRTGNTLRFSGPLSSAEIALQNIFMALSDMDRYAADEKGMNTREFAYMGQGEPGFAYAQVRQAIRITDKVMANLGQKVHRHILATSGITEMVDAFIDDLENNYFEGTRVTFHFSLHATNQRQAVMPIETIYNYRETLRRLPRIKALTGEKPCVGVLLFKNYSNGTTPRNYSTNEQEVLRMADLLDPEVCRLSLCEFNPCDSVGTNGDVTPEEAKKLVGILRNKGFEVKLFASFGKKENTACGLLGGTEPDILVDDTMQSRYNNASSLIAAVCD